MAVDHVLSTSVTNREGSPPVANLAGAGAAARLHSIDDYATVIAAGSVGATYRMVRIPTNARVKRVTFASEAQTAGKFNIGVFYPINGKTGVPDLVANAVSAALFAAAIDCASAVLPTDVTNSGGTYTFDKRSQPLWQAAGLASDPGGYFDIALSVITTAVTTGTGKVYLNVEYEV